MMLDGTDAFASKPTQGSAASGHLVAAENPCGSEPAREGGAPVDENVGCADLFASRLAPTEGTATHMNSVTSEDQMWERACSRWWWFSHMDVELTGLIASKLAPTGEMRSYQEPGRLSGRLSVDVDLRRPVNHAGRTQTLRSGHPGMDAGIAALGPECVKTPKPTLAMIPQDFIARAAHETLHPR